MGVSLAKKDLVELTSPIALRAQLIGIGGCLVQLYGVVDALAENVPPDKSSEVRKSIEELSSRLDLLIDRLEGDDV